MIAQVAKSLDEAEIDLRRPFSPDLVLWRAVRPESGRFGEVVEVAPYINRELVIDRLNVVCPGLWSTRFEPVVGSEPPLMWCHMTVGGVTRPDVGEGRGKALVTDALKRAAVHFGVGVSLGAMPRLECRVGTSERFKVKRLGDDVVLTDAGRAACVRHYEAWLTNTGNAAYGEVLAHAAPDQRRPIIADTRTDVADQAVAPSGPGFDEELVRESRARRIGELAEQLGVEQPLPPDEGDWPKLIETLQTAVDALPVRVAA